LWLPVRALQAAAFGNRRLMTKSDWADYSKTFECKEQEKFMIDVYIDIHESLNFLQ